MSQWQVREVNNLSLTYTQHNNATNNNPSYLNISSFNETMNKTITTVKMLHECPKINPNLWP